MNPEIIKQRYKIVKQIGKGGMSEVFLCEDVLLKTYWAGKRIWKGDGEHSLLSYQSLKKETQMLVHLKHKSIPAIIDCMDNDNTYIVIMDFIDGKSLHQVVLQEHVGEVELMKWAIAILEILQYLHHEIQPPIVFRDLKPENLIVKDDGELMLIDFGIALYLNDASINNTPCLGTRGYASKEQSTPGYIDCRSDIYSFGATLFFLCTKTKYCNQGFPHGRFYNILKKCLQEEVELRYQDVNEVLYDVQRCFKKKHYLRKPCFFAISCFLLSGYAQFQYQDSLEKQYNAYIESQQYEQAISLNPSKQDAYMYYYAEYKKESIPNAIQKMENISFQNIHPLKRDELLYEMAFDCFTLDQSDYYRQAATYLRQIKKKDVTMYIRLCDMLSSHEELTFGKFEEFTSLLKELEAFADQGEYLKQQLQIYDILIRLYTMQQELLGRSAYESVLRIAKKGVALTIQESKESLLFEYQLYFCEKEVLAYGYLGNFLMVQGQRESGQQQLDKMNEQYQIYVQKEILVSTYLQEKIRQLNI